MCQVEWLQIIYGQSHVRARVYQIFCSAYGLKHVMFSTGKKWIQTVSIFIYDNYLYSLKVSISTYLILIELPRWSSGRAFASQAGDRGSIHGRDRPKSWQLRCQTLGNRCECHGSSEMTLIKGWPMSQLVLHVKEPPLSMTIRTEYRSKF